MRTPTIPQLEKLLNIEQVKEARTRTIERLDGGLFISRGIQYITTVHRIYREQLEQEYALSKLRGDFSRLPFNNPDSKYQDEL